MKKAIITGATSFIGRHLIKKLEAEGWMVFAVARKTNDAYVSQFHNGHIRWVCLDMSRYGQLSEIIKEPCDVFVSLAWDGTRGKERDDPLRQKKNYMYSMDALRAVQKIGCRIVISAGSQAEYGPMQDMVDEDTVCRPNTEYGKWKLRYYEDGINFCRNNGMIFKEPRFFSLYGEDDSEDTMILSILRNMVEDKPCRLTECIQMWDFLYIEDAVNGLICLIDMECAGGVYNFGSGDIRVLKEFVMEMYHITNSKSQLLFGAVAYPDTGMVNVCPNISKLQNQTGWYAKTSFSDGIHRILESKMKS